MFGSCHYFKSIAQHMNLTQAAESMFVTQPALSKYLAKLELDLGVKLVDRSKKPLCLTEAGMVYYSYVEDYEKMIRSLKKDLSQFNVYQHHIRIGITTWRGAAILPKVYEAFLPKYPNYDLVFRESVGTTLLKELEARNLDFCLMNLSESSTALGVSKVVLVNEEIRIVMRKQHPFFSRFPQYQDEMYPVDIHHLQTESCILLQPSQQLTKCVEALFRNKDFHPTRTLRLYSMSTALSILDHSDIISFYPHSVRTSSTLNVNLTTRRILGETVQLPFALVYRSDFPLNPACIPVIEFLLNMYEVPLSALNVFL